MINSLSKDSHITQSTCHPKSHPSERSAHRNGRRSSSVSLYSSSTNVNNKTAGLNFCGLLNSKDATKPAAIYTKKWVKDFLEMANDKPSLFSAVYTIGITCLLRPAAIMALPAEKKNADDKKYAAAQSISSGVIGYVIALALFNPVSNAFKKIAKEDGEYLKRESLEYLKDEKASKAAGKYISMLPDTLIAPARAMVTVALIPPILKYVFGMEKKKPEAKIAKAVEQDYSALNFKSTTETNKTAFQNFKGKLDKPQGVSFTGVAASTEKAESKLFAPLKEFFAPATKRIKAINDKIETALADFISENILDSTPARWLVGKTKDSEKLPLHLGTLTGTTLSLFYIKKTLENDKLDSQKKKTLAINQGATTVLSTILSYSFDKLLQSKRDEFIEKFKKINADVNPKLLSKYESGIRTAAQLMVFQTIFRFVAPVAVTPIANHIGNKLQEKKEKQEAEKIGKNQND